MKRNGSIIKPLVWIILSIIGIILVSILITDKNIDNSNSNIVRSKSMLFIENQKRKNYEDFAKTGINPYLSRQEYNNLFDSLNG